MNYMNCQWVYRQGEGWMLVKRSIACPFCPEGKAYAIPVDWTVEQALDWLQGTHALVHTASIAADAAEFLSVYCSRCQRYKAKGLAPNDALHRKCFAAECDCKCSEITSLTPVFSEGQGAQ